MEGILIVPVVWIALTSRGVDDNVRTLLDEALRLG